MTASNGPANIWAGYAKSGVHPLAGYATLVGIFNGLFAGFLLLLRLGDRRLPDRIGFGDIALLTLATYRLSRLLAKDSVTSFIRAPFTEFEKPIGNGEVQEKPRGTGLRHAVGEMLSCPYCLGQWVAAFLAYGLVLWPRVTRLVAGVMAVYALADFLQMGRDALEKQTTSQPEGA